VRQVLQLKASLLLSLSALFLPGIAKGAVGSLHREKPVEMALVCGSDGLLSDSTFWIGWWLKKEEGWHTYWEHPGNVGLTPHLEWVLPEGFTVGELQFPFPQRVQMAGVKAYGHYGETLILAEVKAPKLEVGQNIEFKAKARWMACSNICLPSYTDLSITLPVLASLEPDPVWSSRFQEFLQNRPIAIPANWKVEAEEVGQFTKLSLRAPYPLGGKELYLFGGDRLVCSDADQLFRPSDSGAELLLPKPPWPEETPTHLKGLLRVTEEQGIAAHYTLSIPLR